MAPTYSDATAGSTAATASTSALPASSIERPTIHAASYDEWVYVFGVRPSISVIVSSTYANFSLDAADTCNAMNCTLVANSLAIGSSTSRESCALPSEPNQRTSPSASYVVAPWTTWRPSAKPMFMTATLSAPYSSTASDTRSLRSETPAENSGASGL